MSWLGKMFKMKNIDPPHIGENDTTGEKIRRLATLSSDEQVAYKWLFEGYSEAWITETMGLEKKDAKKLYSDIYRKLGITCQQEIIRYFAP